MHFVVVVVIAYVVLRHAREARNERKARAAFEHQGKRATVELDSHGRLVQASGPWNSENEAVLWGARELEECARIGRERRFRRKSDAARASAPFDRLRQRLGRFEWLDIAERMHERALEEC